MHSYDFLDNFGSNQHGFHKYASTTTLMIALHDHIITLAKSENIGAILVPSFDLTKAFDQVSYLDLFIYLCSTMLPCGFVT